MDFEELVRIASQSFPKNGSFELLPGEPLRERIRKAGVPDKPGVYLICGTERERCRLLQIGKAGTLKGDGLFKNQKLRGRLGAKQEGMSRDKFFQIKMSKLQLDSLRFYWFVTFDKDDKDDKHVFIIPAKAEADLLQRYFDDNGKLPLWNKNL